MLHAVILYSVGSPENLTTACLKDFLNRFLSDKLVVKLPRFLWQPILHSFILRTRPERMLSRYQQIFIDNHNPYLLAMDKLSYELERCLNKASARSALALAHAKEAHEALDLANSLNSIFDDDEQKVLADNLDDKVDPTTLEHRFVVKAAYAYSGKGLKMVINECLQNGASKVTVVPMFPQYSDTTTMRPYLDLAELKAQSPKVEFDFVTSYADEPLYIDAIAKSIKVSLSELLNPIKHNFKKDDYDSIMGLGKAHMLITYHSLPQSYIKLGDPYLKDVEATTKALTEKLGIRDDNYSVAYQSRMGPMPWLQPYIEDKIEELLQRGITRLVVVAPGFSIDCLETLYDLAIKMREHFLNLGGESFIFVPALNDSKAQVKLMAHLVLKKAEPLAPLPKRKKAKKK